MSMRVKSIGTMSGAVAAGGDDLIGELARARASRRATSTSSWPFAAKTRASAAPMPDDAPVIRVTGRTGAMCAFQAAGRGR